MKREIRERVNRVSHSITESPRHVEKTRSVDQIPRIMNQEREMKCSDLLIKGYREESDKALESLFEKLTKNNLPYEKWINFINLAYDGLSMD